MQNEEHGNEQCAAKHRVRAGFRVLTLRASPPEALTEAVIRLGPSMAWKT